ncbi:MAG: tetratricopeptide repeat protein [Chloroflexi bacterium]|nr:tetratricopeptide repeat protein [Chloroflexota bacterium]
MRAFAWYSLAVLRRAIGVRSRRRHHFVAAEWCYGRALGLVEKHIAARLGRGLLRWRELDDWAGAIHDFSTLLALHPTQHLALFYRGMAYYRGGNYHAAAHDLASFIQAAPESPWVHHATIQLEGMNAILDDLPKLLPPPGPRLLED